MPALFILPELPVGCFARNKAGIFSPSYGNLPKLGAILTAAPPVAERAGAWYNPRGGGEHRMSTVVTSHQTRVEPTIDQAAAAFADQHGLWQDLTLAIELLHDKLPGLVAIQVDHLIDPESTDYECLYVLSTVSGDVEEILDCEHDFCAALCAAMPAERRQFFGFTVIPI